jgi:hypothetical protein
VRTLLLLVLPLLGFSLLARVPPAAPASESFFPPLAREFTPELAKELVEGPVPRLHDGRAESRHRVAGRPEAG